MYSRFKQEQFSESSRMGGSRIHKINEDYRISIKDFACHCEADRRKEGNLEVYPNGFEVRTCLTCGWTY